MRINTGYIKVGKTAKKIMKEILNTSRISCGKYVSEFEKMYAEKHNIKYAITVGSGTDADLLALYALKTLTNEGHYTEYGRVYSDEVIVPAISFISVANAVLLSGYKPVFVDTDPFNMDLEEVRTSIGIDTKAILAVHFGGLPLNMNMLKDIAGDIPIIEDCACSHGSVANKRITGSHGLLSTWSLYTAHIVSAGSGGVIGTNDKLLADTIYSIRAYGRSCICRPCIANITGDRCIKRFQNEKDMRFLYKRIGYNSRMTEMEAAIGIDQLEIYDEIVQKRINNFNFLKTLLIEKQNNNRYFTTFPNLDNDYKTCPVFFPIVLADYFNRDKVVAYLEEKGIETRNLYACIPTQQPVYKNHFQYKEVFPNAERIGRQGLYVGIHQGLSNDDLEYIAEQFFKALKEAI